MSNSRDVFDYIAIALALVNAMGLFVVIPVVRGFVSLREHMDSIRDVLVQRIEALERWRAAETGIP